MKAFICTTCGTQFAPSAAPPDACLICEDERQYVPLTGQAWTTLDRLQLSHMPIFRYEAELMAVGIAPAFGINQRALIVPTAQGNVLWDCVSLISDAMVGLIQGIGGIQAIAISHPHYYTTQVEWSRAFGGIPVHLHAADREWVMRPDPCIQFWECETKEIAPGLTLIRTGGHYEGGTVMHWQQGHGGRGAILSGDLLQVVADRKHLGFMRSYPNYIPLGARAVEAVAGRVAPFAYDAIYGAFWGGVIPANAKRAMDVSVARHLEWLERPAL
ncbi:MBL fold metallo-hydrolase [Roseomonas harenae]|uniref:MBL fold metallo-hydrolase n=1 Tax=Muricoccus harenae TaxID=2692566 RepID=UPI0013312428|nr:MBL fold metallo-hydrolase [Roseomonas harenae]